MKYLILPLFLMLLVSSCKKQEGCTNPTAINYNADAENDDGSCLYICLDEYATNLNDTTSVPVCEYESSIIIWLDETASQYFASLNVPFLSVSVANEQISTSISTDYFYNDDDINCVDTISGPIHHIFQWQNEDQTDVQFTVFDFAGTIIFQSTYPLYPSGCFKLQLTRAKIEAYQVSQ